MATDKVILTQIVEALAQQSDTLHSLIAESVAADEYVGQWEHLRDELNGAQSVALRAMRWAKG